VVASWTAVQLAKGQTAWVPNSCVVVAGENAKIGRSGRPAGELLGLLKKAEEYSPAVQADARPITGQIYAREANTAFGGGNYGEAVKLFEQAAGFLTSGDPRLEKAFDAWVRSHLVIVGTIGLGILAAVGASFLFLLSRQKRVRRPKEFTYYGKDRVRHERELEEE
jgi:hypothetical protein